MMANPNAQSLGPEVSTAKGASGTWNAFVVDRKIAVKLDFYPLLFDKNNVPEEKTNFYIPTVKKFNDFYLLADADSKAVIVASLVEIVDSDRGGDVIPFENNATGYRDFSGQLSGFIAIEVENETLGSLTYQNQERKKSITIGFNQLARGSTSRDPSSNKAIFFTTTDRIGVTRINVDLTITTVTSAFRCAQTESDRILGSHLDTSYWLFPLQCCGSRILTQGSKGWDVQKLQWLFSYKLKGARGEIVPYHLDAIDGDFAGHTTEVLKRFGFATYFRESDTLTVDEHVLKSLRTHVDDYAQAISGNLGSKVDKTHASYSAWIAGASLGITELAGRYGTPQFNNITPERLWKALLLQETVEIHWDNKVITLSKTGAVGFCQVQPFNCVRYNNKHVNNAWVTEDVCNNLYLPEPNMKAGAFILNRFLKIWTNDADQLEKALASYNGGLMKWIPNKDWKYHVENRTLCKGASGTGVNVSREMTTYAINIKRFLGLVLKDYENDFLDARVALSGRVTDLADKDKKGIQGVSVVINTSYQGMAETKTTATDRDGKFVVRPKEGRSKIKLSHVDYEDVEATYDLYEIKEIQFETNKKKIPA